jgi:hypothetical protein
MCREVRAASIQSYRVTDGGVGRCRQADDRGIVAQPHDAAQDLARPAAPTHRDHHDVAPEAHPVGAVERHDCPLATAIRQAHISDPMPVDANLRAAQRPAHSPPQSNVTAGDPRRAYRHELAAHRPLGLRGRNPPTGRSSGGAIRMRGGRGHRTCSADQGNGQHQSDEHGTFVPSAASHHQTPHDQRFWPSVDEMLSALMDCRTGRTPEARASRRLRHLDT